MATGYTQGVRDGSVTDFRKFTMQCARAFGALISMRDDPMDAPIPEKIEPMSSSYHTEALKNAKAELVVLSKMSSAEIHTAATAAYERLIAEWEASEVRRKDEKARYGAMLAQVKAWMPPTKDHQGLKDFMLQQLSESIKFDCQDGWERPKHRTPSVWHAEQIARVTNDITYHTEHEKDDVNRANERTEWVQQLRDSLSAVKA